MIPKDPFMLYSYINAQLRDHYESLQDLCAALDLDAGELTGKLDAAGFEYNEELNRFV